MPQALPSALLFLPALAAWLALLSLPVFRIFADDKPRQYVTIDGLRGFLAISVFAHHFIITAQWQRLGKWTSTPDYAWNAMGHAAVTLFFMITGFLFFGKIQNPARKLRFAEFLRARLLRIYPVYLICLLCVALVAISLPDVTVTLFAATKSFGLWLIFCPQKLFGLNNAGITVAYAPWTLRYEWCFYLLLPTLAWAWRLSQFHPAFLGALCLSALCLVQWPMSYEHGSLSLDTRFIAPFVLGGAALFPARNVLFRQIAQGPAGSVVALIALAAVCMGGEPYSVKSYIVIIMAFLPIAAGASLFGILKIRAMLILGAVSYDVYILHGLVLFALFHLAMPNILVNISNVAFLFYLLMTGIAVLGVSLIVHRMIEVPAMTMSMRLRSADPRERLAAP